MGKGQTKDGSEGAMVQVRQCHCLVTDRADASNLPAASYPLPANAAMGRTAIRFVTSSYMKRGMKHEPGVRLGHGVGSAEKSSCSSSSSSSRCPRHAVPRSRFVTAPRSDCRINNSRVILAIRWAIPHSPTTLTSPDSYPPQTRPTSPRLYPLPRASPLSAGGSRCPRPPLPPSRASRILRSFARRCRSIRRCAVVSPRFGQDE